MRRFRGRAWGNALGGWRRQGRDGKGRWLPKGAAFRQAHKVGKMSQYRSTYKRQGGSGGVKSGALAAATYGVGAMNSLRSAGFFINPEIGLAGGGVSAGYGRQIAPGWRGSVAIKVSVRRNNDPVKDYIDKGFKAAGADGGNLHNLVKYGVAQTPIDGTVLVRSGTTIRMKSGGKAARAARAVPAQRAVQDREKKQKAAYRAERRKAARGKDIGNGHKVVQKNSWDSYKGSRNRAEIGLEHNRIRNNQNRRKTAKRSNKKGVASTITA